MVDATPPRRAPMAMPGLTTARGRDAGLIAVSIALVSVGYYAAAESMVSATAATVAIGLAAAMHARLATSRVAAIILVIGSATVLRVLGAPPRLVGVVVVAGLVSSELISGRPQRSAILTVSAWLAAVAGAVSLLAVAVASLRPQGVVFRETLAAVVGGFLSAPLMVTFGPLVERLFGHVTRLTMNDWLSYEHPLLKRLAAEAPGSFQHSVNVGVLADAAVGAFGGDRLLARLGGLYHDVGKAEAPEFFIENQRGDNPHDTLPPWQSAGVLRAHVTDGVELVTRHGMGERIAEFVREHHGTSEMRLLSQKAATLGDDSGETYRYPGPKPRSRETGIVMIADQLEATARAEPPADDAACQQVVRRTVERIQREGQLDESGLTVGDLSAAERAFSRALLAMYHRRLSYPPTDTNLPQPTRPRLVFPRRPRRGIAS